jgi:CrcB protein
VRVVAAAIRRTLRLCGTLTTYSTSGYETVRLMEDGVRAYAVLNVVASIVAGLGSAFCGIAAEALWF